MKWLWYPMEVQSKAYYDTPSRSDRSLRAVLKGDPEGVATLLSVSDNGSGIYTCFYCSAEREREREKERETETEAERQRERETTPFRTHRQKD